MNDRNEIYIAVSKTNSRLGGLIRIATRYESNHVAVSLCNDLQPLFSFARRFNNEPLVGGMVEESWLRYLYYGQDVRVKIYKIEVTGSDFAQTKERLQNMSENRGLYKYDLFGLYNRSRRANRFTCLTFAIDILKQSNAPIQLDKIRSIRRLCKALEPYYFCEREIRVQEINRFTWGNDEFYVKKSRLQVLTDTVKYLASIMFY